MSTITKSIPFGVKHSVSAIFAMTELTIIDILCPASCSAFACGKMLFLKLVYLKLGLLNSIEGSK